MTKPNIPMRLNLTDSSLENLQWDETLIAIYPRTDSGHFRMVTGRSDGVDGSDLHLKAAVDEYRDLTGAVLSTVYPDEIEVDVTKLDALYWYDQQR